MALKLSFQRTPLPDIQTDRRPYETGTAYHSFHAAYEPCHQSKPLRQTLEPYSACYFPPLDANSYEYTQRTIQQFDEHPPPYSPNSNAI
ncbi:hypothetical protein BCR33DRAFT_719689 [Rhizoclosmatium globosum]|uniref:Uncharacterized protein n=1 Tax=Rhizoclosmatium globosum TaxID=329046 RepID=A0A1Y2BYY8_9FUNG|nr:hypothetical protein BCR33DRAFT_719689 [Rhizoclosmatium globosum]|eukprot:ORY39857.1 hypothetical protein BCR33DRAFT_719689 [Rhizoclosmatium globosum]